MGKSLIVFYLLIRNVMKKHVLSTVLAINTVIAMNNNDTRPVYFAEPSVLLARLACHDQKNNTNYAALGIAETLGNTARLRSEADRIIKAALSKNGCSVTEAESIEIKRNIMGILRPELVRPKL